MRFRQIPFLIVMLCCLGVIASRAQQEPYNKALQLVEVEFDSPKGLEPLLQRGLDVWEMEEHRALLYVTSDELRQLKELNLVLRDRSGILEGAKQLKARDGYLTLAEYEAAMNAWAVAHPDIVSVTSIGSSWEGRDIWMLKLSANVAVDEDEPEAMLISLQHAREWLGGMTLYGHHGIFGQWLRCRRHGDRAARHDGIVCRSCL